MKTLVAVLFLFLAACAAPQQRQGDALQARLGQVAQAMQSGAVRPSVGFQQIANVYRQYQPGSPMIEYAGYAAVQAEQLEAGRISEAEFTYRTDAKMAELRERAQRSSAIAAQQQELGYQQMMRGLQMMQPARSATQAGPMICDTRGGTTICNQH